MLVPVMHGRADGRERSNGTLRKGAGATLVELVVAIVIAGIVASVASVFISRPVQGYVDLSRRATLVDAAESAVRRMARDIRTALPNSVRVTNTPGGGFALELVPIVDGGKYTTDGQGTVKINLHGNFDADFDNLGCFRVIAPGTYDNYRIVVNNLGTPGFDVYTTTGVVGSSTGVITPVGLRITITNNAGATCSPSSPSGVGDQHIHFSDTSNVTANHAFADSSPQNRFFVVERPITYLCDRVNGTLTRYANYAMQATQPTTAAALNALSGVTSALVADRVSACSIRMADQDVRNRGLVSIDLSVAQDGETIRLIHQAQLDNSR